MAKIRVVNLAYDTLNISASLGSATFTTSTVGKTTASPFYTVTPGNYTIKIGDLTNIGSILFLNGQTIESGRIYTIIYTGIINAVLLALLQVKKQ